MRSAWFLMQLYWDPGWECIIAPGPDELHDRQLLFQCSSCLSLFFSVSLSGCHPVHLAFTGQRSMLQDTACTSTDNKPWHFVSSAALGYSGIQILWNSTKSAESLDQQTCKLSSVRSVWGFHYLPGPNPHSGLQNNPQPLVPGLSNIRRVMGSTLWWSPLTPHHSWMPSRTLCGNKGIGCRWFPSSSWSCQCSCGCGTVVKRHIM